MKVVTGDAIGGQRSRPQSDDSHTLGATATIAQCEANSGIAAVIRGGLLAPRQQQELRAVPYRSVKQNTSLMIAEFRGLRNAQCPIEVAHHDERVQSKIADINKDHNRHG